MNRRSFLAGILAAGVAPAIVRISSLMPVRAIEVATLGQTLTFGGKSFNLFEDMERIDSMARKMAQQTNSLMIEINESFYFMTPQMREILGVPA